MGGTSKNILINHIWKIFSDLIKVVETELVEIEFYGITVESRALPAAWYGWILAYANKGPGKYCTKKPINIMIAASSK